MRRRPCRAGAVAIVSVITVLTGCQSPQTAEISPTRIGLVVPLSGDSATYGNNAQQGAQLAIDLLNGTEQNVGLPLIGSGSSQSAAGPLELIVAKTESDTQKAADAVSRLISDSETAVLIGAYDDEVTAAASERAEELAVPFVNVDSTRADLTERGLHWFFRVGPTDQIVSEAFLRLMERVTAKLEDESNRLGVTYPALPVESAIASEVSSVISASGYEVIDLPFADTEPDFDSLEDEPAVDAVIAIALDVEVAANTIRSLRAVDALNSSAIAGMGEGFENDGFAVRAQDAAADVLIVADWTAELVQHGGPVSEVADLYLDRFSTPLTAEAAASFTAVYVIAHALEDAGSADRASLRDALSDLDMPGREVIMPWDGVQFDKRQQNSDARGVVSQQVEDSRVLVYPFDLARDAVRWPAASAAG
jgi:branched-chain amino acid transport system substrate-binding protein